ncbi:MAG: extradiol dioxygenase [Coxiella sp. (in: Bacteria)]|nr:MAG: extradiol dioxygenase [Coxiella sp. (in: g-proteobacteria)]
MQSKPPNVANQFYPGDPNELSMMVAGLMEKSPKTNRLPKAMIVPHAGLIYSGYTASCAYQVLQAHADQIRRVVLIGPSHHFKFSGIAVTSFNYFETPLGRVAIDIDYMPALASLVGVTVSNQAFEKEHCLEVQLPFLQALLPNFKLIPAIISDASPDLVARFLLKVWGGDETLILVSSDLSHYHSYAEAQRIDQATASAIVTTDIKGVRPETACGSRGINGLLTLANERDMRMELIDLRNSGDTAGDKSRVVGYGAYYCFENKKVTQLLTLARSAIDYGCIHHAPMPLPDGPLEDLLNQPGNCFVTIEKNGQLRGCIGTIIGKDTLAQDIINNAYKAAFKDPRFPPLTADEFAQCDIHISILTPPHEMTFQSEADLLTQLQPGKDGLILKTNTHQGVFLPSVWDKFSEPQEFLKALKQKAGLPSDYWSSDICMYRYYSQEY